MHNHETKECKFLGQSKCGIFNRFRHRLDECYLRKPKDLKHKREKGDGKDGKDKKKKKKKEEMNQGEEEEDKEEHIAFCLDSTLDIPLDEI